MKESLDRHITGNYGEDQFRSDMTDPEQDVAIYDETCGCCPFRLEPCVMAVSENWKKCPHVSSYVSLLTKVERLEGDVQYRDWIIEQINRAMNEAEPSAIITASIQAILDEFYGREREAKVPETPQTSGSVQRTEW